MADQTIDLVYERVAEQASRRRDELMYWEIRSVEEANLGRIATEGECIINSVGLRIPLNGRVGIDWNLHEPPSLHCKSARESSSAMFYRQTPVASLDPLAAMIGDSEVLGWLDELPIESAKVIHYASAELGKIIDVSSLSISKQTNIKKYSRKWVRLNRKYFSEIGISPDML